MLIFSQFGEIAWQRLFNIVRILQTIALKTPEFTVKFDQNLGGKDRTEDNLID